MREMRRVSDEWMQILVIYDVEDNKVRSKVVRILESFGIRVQKSAFECNLNDKRLDILKKQLSNVIGSDDSIRIYNLRDDCFDVAKHTYVPVYSQKTAIV